jgi:hypothetical protein
MRPLRGEKGLSITTVELMHREILDNELGCGTFRSACKKALSRAKSVEARKNRGLAALNLLITFSLRLCVRKKLLTSFTEDKK